MSVGVVFKVLVLVLGLGRGGESRAAFTGSPIVLVPGDGGSQLEAKLDKPVVPHYVCKKHTDTFFTLWLNLELLPPLVIDCWVDNMLLIYNETSRTTRNNDGVETRVPGWGDTASVEWLDPSRTTVSQYFAAIVTAAVSWGYTRGKDIRGAPYDFRKAPNEGQQYFEDLKALIEETYYNNGNKKVVLVGHSMGNPYILYFLNRQTQDWKDKFIRSYVSIAGPWGGAAKILQLFASGYNMDHYSIILPPLKLRKQQRSMPSSAFLIPSAKFWAENETLVHTERRNYSAWDMQDFFTDIGYPTGWAMYQDTKDLIYDLKPPGVEVHCLYGSGVKTPEVFVYGGKKFPNAQPTEVFGDGDGTVNRRSLLGCLDWQGAQRQAVYSREFPGQEHLAILLSQDVIAYIKGAVLGPGRGPSGRRTGSAQTPAVPEAGGPGGEGRRP